MAEFQALFTPLHRGTIATVERNLNRSTPNPFAKFGRVMGCTHYTTQFEEVSLGSGMTTLLEVVLADGSHPRVFCSNHRMKTANGFLCETHTKEVFPMRRPKEWNPVLSNQLDALDLVRSDKALLRGKVIKSTRLLTDDPSIKLRRVGYLKTVQ